MVTTALTIGLGLVATESAGALTVHAASCNQPALAGQFRCFSLIETAPGKHTFADQYRPGASTHGGYGPAELAAAYSLPKSSTSATVAVIDAYDDPHAESDLAVYRRYYNLPACTRADGCFRKVNQNGAATSLPAVDQGWSGETALDLAMVSATCPSCHILLVEANQASSDLYVAVQTAVALGAKYVSMSWGAPEMNTEAVIDRTVFNATGVAYVAASGDGGYGVNYPAASAHVLAVGGTSLRPARNARGWSESVWQSSAGLGTGSGCSRYIAKPAWQSSVSTALCGKRAVADVSAVADPATGVAVYQTVGLNGWFVYGGTSAAAPIIASMYALAGTPSPGDGPASYPYGHPASLNDITAGSNGHCGSALCTATAGWDGPTGLGSPNGVGAFRTSGLSGARTSVPVGANSVTVTQPGNVSSVIATPSSHQILARDSIAGTPLSYQATALPAGLSIDRMTGAITGRPVSLGTYPVTVTVTDSAGAWTKVSYQWAVTQNPAVCSGQVLSNGGFQQGSLGWSATRGVIRTNSRLARSGHSDAQLGGTGRALSQSLSRAVTITRGCKATLSYSLRITSSDTSHTAHDTLAVTSNGHRVALFSNLNRGGYLRRSVVVTLGASGRLLLSWVARENRGKPTTFILDDVTLRLTS